MTGRSKGSPAASAATSAPDSKTAPEGAVGPDRSGGVQHDATPQEAGPDTSPRTRTAVIVDGFNLYHGLRQRYGRRYLWLDLLELGRRLRPRDEIVAITYCTALVENDPDGRQRQENYLAALRAHCGPVLDVVLGRFQAKTRRCRSCGASWPSYEEKETDVNLAVALVSAAANDSVDLVLLISADSDLCPAIRAARSVSPDLGVIAAFPPRRSSFEIQTLVPGNFMIGQTKIRGSLLPDIVDGSGGRHVRPEEWR